MEKLKLIFANLILEYEQALEKVFFLAQNCIYIVGL